MMGDEERRGTVLTGVQVCTNPPEVFRLERIRFGDGASSVAKTDWSVRRDWASALYAANPNSWLMTRFWARTSPLAIPSNWPVRSMCIAS